MKKQLKYYWMIAAAFLLLQGCSKGEEPSNGGGSREVKYEITGNFSGSFIVVATTNNDDYEVIEVTKLPWKNEFTAKSSIKLLVATATGSKGKTGETATLKMYVGGKEVRTGGGTATSFGALSMTNNVYMFE